MADADDVLSAVSSTFARTPATPPCRFPEACACIDNTASAPACGPRKDIVKAKLVSAATAVHGILERGRRHHGGTFTQHEMHELTAAINAALGTNVPHFTPHVLTDVEWGCSVLCETSERVTDPDTEEEAIARRAILTDIAAPFFAVPANRRHLLQFILRRAQGEYPPTHTIVNGSPAAAAALWLVGVPVPVFGGDGGPTDVDDLTDDEDEDDGGAGVRRPARLHTPPPPVMDAAPRDDALEAVQMRHTIINFALAVFGLEWSIRPVPGIILVASGEMVPTPHVVTSDAEWQFVKKVVGGCPGTESV